MRLHSAVWQSNSGERYPAGSEPDHSGWLTTVAKSGQPKPQLGWFYFDGRDVIVYSEPNTDKVRHIRNHPRVSLNLDSDGNGSGVIVVGWTTPTEGWLSCRDGVRDAGRSTTETSPVNAIATKAVRCPTPSISAPTAGDREQDDPPQTMRGPVRVARCTAAMARSTRCRQRRIALPPR